MPIENQITIVRVMSDPDFAQREIDRLNAVNGHKGARYFMQTTRLDLRQMPTERPGRDG